MAIREKMIDQSLYAAGAQDTVNSLVGFAEFSLTEIVVWFQIVLRQPGLQARKIDQADLFGFTWHLQLVGELDFDPTESEYPGWVLIDIPNPVPVRPSGLYVTTGGSSCEYETGRDVYELWSDTGAGFKLRSTGVVRGDLSGVDFAYTGIVDEVMRAMTKSGTFYSFPTDEIVVA